MTVDLGVDAIEIRKDLPGVEILDGTPAATVRDMAADHGLTVLAVNALYPFNVWNREREAEAVEMVRYARDCGARGIAMCPLKDADDARSESERHAALIDALKAMATILRDHGVTGHVEPLGFPESTLRRKRPALDAIAEVGGEDVFNLMHDTFHHAVASDPDCFPERTGLAQISGVEDAAVSLEAMQDGHRVLVGEADRLGNVAQMRQLIDAGYQGYFSFEPFAESIMELDDPKSALKASMDYLQAAVDAA